MHGNFDSLENANLQIADNTSSSLYQQMHEQAHYNNNEVHVSIAQESKPQSVSDENSLSKLHLQGETQSVQDSTAQICQEIIARGQARLKQVIDEKLQQYQQAVDMQSKFRAKRKAALDKLNDLKQHEESYREQLLTMQAQDPGVFTAQASEYEEASPNVITQNLMKVFDKEEKHWTRETARLRANLFAIEEQMFKNFDDLAEPTDALWAKQKLKKMHLFGETESPNSIEFQWPNPNQLTSIGFTKGTKVTDIKVLATNSNFKGIQVKLSNGVSSPLFAQTWNSIDNKYQTNERSLFTVGCHLPTNKQIRSISLQVKKPEDSRSSSFFSNQGATEVKSHAEVLQGFGIFGNGHDLLAEIYAGQKDSKAQNLVFFDQQHVALGVYGSFGLDQYGDPCIQGLGLITYQVEV